MHGDSTPTIDSRPGLIYIIQARATGLIKIGFTRHFEGRISSVRTDNADTIDVLAVVEGSQRLERGLHAAFSAHRVKGEWFQPSAEMLLLVASLRDSDPERMKTHAERACQIPRVTAIWDALVHPTTVDSLAAMLGCTPASVRVLMNKYPNRFRQSGQTRVEQKGRPRVVWGRVTERYN